jgi:membrane associated rhomboid family serine protease
VFLDSGELSRIRRVAAQELGFDREQDARLLAQIVNERRAERQARSARQRLVELKAAHSSGDYFLAYLLGLPVEEGSDVRSTPLVVYGLMTLLAVMWVLQLAAGVENTVLRWGLVPEVVRSGRDMVTAVTSVFLHGGWLHVFSNLYGLWIFGDDVEDGIGSRRFLLCFVMWGLAGSIFTVLLTSGPATALPHIGASGAVAGIIGAYAVLFPGNRFVIPVVGFLFLGVMARMPVWLFAVFWVVLQGASGLLELPAIGWWAHAGGFTCGAVTAFFLRGRLSGERTDFLPRN